MPRRGLALVLAASYAVASGCQGVADYPPAALPGADAFLLVPPLPAALAPGPPELPPTAQLAANPALLPVTDGEFFWNQLVDTVDDYFDIQSERRPRMAGAVLTEGRIETQPLPGATVFEPWLWDSRPGYQRRLATLQSVRRRASVRVVPTGTAYEVYVTVQLELEEVEQTAQSTPGSAIPRHDLSLPRTDFSLTKLAVGPTSSPRTIGWIPLGRDVELEQEILRQLRGRLFDQSPYDEPKPTWPP